MHRRIAAITVALGVLASLPGSADVPDAKPDCAGTRAREFLGARGVADPAGDVRVYAIQYKQEIRHVETYASFALKMDCLLEELVLPTADEDRDGKADRPTIVVLNEDAGLATIATGTRGAAARAIAAFGPKDPQNIPGALAAFGSLAAGYAPAIAYYALREPETSPQRLILAAATDAFARGFMKVNSDLARRYGVYVVSSNNQAEFRETSAADAVAALADPDLSTRYATGELTSVYEAVDVDPIGSPETTGRGRAGIDVFNKAFMWAPVDPPQDHPVQSSLREVNGGPLSASDPRRNIIHVNKKTPLTSLETQILDLSDDRDTSPSNTGPFCLLPSDDPGCAIKIGYGISLPAFMWGSDFGETAPLDVAPCSTPTLWMRCLDERGVNLFLQPEANPGMWAEYTDLSWTPTSWQALSWLDSAWRAVADPTVRTIRYAVTPHLVGNLVDITFDGQSVIFERCLQRDEGDTCAGNVPSTFVGASEFLPCEGRTERCDDPRLGPYWGAKAETIVAAPWVLPDCPECLRPIANREYLATRARAMQAGSMSPSENDYLETAVWADLDLD